MLGDTEHLSTDLLSPLTGVCTHDLLHQARIHSYGEDYATFPTDKLGSLLSLGQAGHVPSNTPQTVEFESHVRKFVTWLLDTYWTKRNPDWYKGFTVKPIGSFPCDTKVGDINEFDYLCVLNLDLKDFEIKDYKDGKWKGSLDTGHREYQKFNRGYQRMFQNLAPYDSRSPQKLSISAIYKHGPATCIEITWTCINGHEHGFGVDVSLATEMKDTGFWFPWFMGWLFPNETTLTRALQSKFKDLPQPFHGLVDMVKTHIFVYTDGVVFDWALSSCTYDSPLMEVLKNSITPHIRSLFRCLKLLTKHILPHSIRKDSNREGWRAGESVTSHCLKCLLFDEVGRHINKKDWEGDKLSARLAGILEGLAAAKHKDMIEWPVCVDIITRTKVASSTNLSFFIHPKVSQDLMAFSAHLARKKWNRQEIDGTRIAQVASNHYKKSSAIIGENKATSVVSYLKGLGGTLHVADLSGELVLFAIELYGYTLKDTAPLHAHPLIQWCRQHISELYQTNRGVDLTQVSAEDLPHVWGLAYCGTLTEMDITSGRYRDIVAALYHMVDTHRHPVHKDRLWPWYLDGCIEGIHNPLPLVTAYLSQVTRENLQLILRSTMYTLPREDMTSNVHDQASLQIDRQMSMLQKLGDAAKDFRKWWQTEMGPQEVKVVVYQTVHNMLVNKATTYNQSKLV